MKNVLTALAKVQAEIDTVVKVKRPGMQYKVVMYDDLLDTIREEVLKAGLTLVPHDCLHVASTPYDRIGNNGAVHMNREVYVFTFRLYHVPSGEYLQLSTPGDGVDEMDKGPGKALTYATKTAWEKLLLLSRGDAADPDSRPSASGQRQVPPPQQQQQQQQKPPQQAPPVSAEQSAFWEAEYKRDVDAFGSVKDMNDLAEFSVVNMMKYIEKRLDEKGAPGAVKSKYLSAIFPVMAKTAMESKHAYSVGREIEGNMAMFKKYLGDDERVRKLSDFISQQMAKTQV